MTRIKKRQRTVLHLCVALHRDIDAAYCYRCRAFNVCLSHMCVCLLGTPASSAKTTEPIKMPSGADLSRPKVFPVGSWLSFDLLCSSTMSHTHSTDTSLFYRILKTNIEYTATVNIENDSICMKYCITKFKLLLQESLAESHQRRMRLLTTITLTTPVRFSHCSISTVA